MSKPEIVLHPEISKWRRTRRDAELRKDLKEKGQLQNMVFRKLKDGKLELLAGNSRYEELTSLGVPFEQWDKKILENISDKDALLIAMSENRFRRKLSAVEEGRMFDSMMKLHMPIEEIALRYKCSETYVRNRLELLSLPDEVQTKIENGEIAFSYAKCISRLNELPVAQKLLIKAIKEGNDSSYQGVRSVEDADEFVEKTLAHIRIVQGLVLKYGPCPNCGSKDIEQPYSWDENKLKCNKCEHEWHKETKDPWEFHTLKEKAEKMGLKLDLVPSKGKPRKPWGSEEKDNVEKVQEFLETLDYKP